MEKKDCRRIRRWTGKRGGAGRIAFLLTFGLLGSGSLYPVAAEPATEPEAAEELLIEDFGEEITINSGVTLEQIRESERRESELASESEAEARAREEVLQKEGLRLAAADPQILEEHLGILTAVESPTGSDGELICADYIEKIMKQYGYTISEQSFHEGFLNENGVDVPGLNIIAERGANAKERTEDIFILAAHYDSKTDPAPEDPLSNDKTGAAVLLELARILAEVETDSDICFVFFSGEEDGGYGSARFVEFMEEGYGHRISGVLYVEQVGYDAEENYLLKTTDGKENRVGQLLLEAKERMFGPEMPEEETILPEEERETEDTTEESMIPAEENWIWTSDRESAQYRFSNAGMEAVTVCQELSGTEEMLSVDPSRLAALTDLLADMMKQVIQ